MIFSTLCSGSVHAKWISVAKSAKKMRNNVIFARMHNSEDLNGTHSPPDGNR